MLDGSKIREAREAKGWSQAKLGEEAGTTQQTIDRIESGQVKHTRCAARIEAALGITDRTDGVPERIAKRLESTGKNASSVALEAGLGRSSVRDIITNEANPRIDTLRKLTGPLECSLEYLIGLSEDVGIAESSVVNQSMASPESVLQIAASQWDGIPAPRQIIAALAAGGFKIVPTSSDAIGPFRALQEGKASLEIGARIAARRKYLGLSQEQLSELLDCHWVTVSKLERHEMDLTVEWLVRIATALRIEPETLLQSQSAIDDPVAFIKEIVERRNIAPGALALSAGISASTLTRALNDPNHKFKLSVTTLQKIKEWDQCQ